ncbi:arginine--tRNA ligase [Nocardia wallacei]|uniref:arginine--tRNA ligase domain-containing protein n=1 Tax=Nocardia wallacei TaxID=480035 RepID=UPI0024588C2E|nr:arginine--tRNA ligase [Nocardia wallacei]
MSPRRTHTLVRDHPRLNPYLRQLPLRPGTPAYWQPDGTLVQHTETGAPQPVPIATSTLLKWMSDHDPEQLWEPWRTHLRGQRVLVEHTSINPVHPLHVGSLRSTVIGSTLAELFRSGGADVQTRYFVNDLGRQLHILQRAAVAARWDRTPAGHRYDEVVGVLYAFANMALANRTTDLARLRSAHPWLTDMIDIDRPLPPAAPTPELVDAMVAAAISDMGILGAKIDVFEHESDLAADPDALIARLGERCDLVRINGTTCVRLPGGIVPARRRDGSLLYFARDLANTQRRRPHTWSAILHVIGTDQTLLQTALRQAVPDAPLEHIAFGQISCGGRRYSARRDRLTTMSDLLHNGGHRRIHELTLALAMHRRTHPLDLTHLDTTQPLRTVHTALDIDRNTGTVRPHQEPLRRLLIAVLGTPAVLARDVDRRTIHGTARHLTLLSQHHIAATRAGSVPDAVGEWSSRTRTRLAALLGITPPTTEPPRTTSARQKDPRP